MDMSCGENGHVHEFKLYLILSGPCNMAEPPHVFYTAILCGLCGVGLRDSVGACGRNRQHIDVDKSHRPS